MMKVTIFGHGHLAQAIGNQISHGDNQVEYLTHEDGRSLGSMVILAVPYSAIADVEKRYSQQLADKIIADATNPIDFQHW